MRAIARLLFALFALGPLFAPAFAGPPSPADEVNRRAWQPREFPISFWCGPPEGFHTVERFREIAEAGFTVVSPPCTQGGPHGSAATVERNRAMLDLCRQAGLTMFVADNRMPARISGDPTARDRIRAITDAYKGHPALAGYAVRDEPVAEEFAGLGEVVSALRAADPDHPSWINLFPYTDARPAWGAPDYTRYMADFVDTVKPFALSYDHYTFTKGGDALTFIKNLAVARDVSRQKGIPFWNIVLVTEHGHYRNLTEPEIRYEAMQTLAYGAKGLVWFTYWTPVDSAFQWTHAMVNLDGSRDAHYDMVKRVNWEVRAYGSALLHADAVAVFHTRPLPPGGAPWSEGLPIRVLGDAALTVGVFRGANGENYALVANADYRNAAAFEVAIRAPGVQRMSRLSRRWSPAAATRAEGAETLVPLTLEPAEAALLRW